MIYTLGKATLYFVDKDGHETSMKINSFSVDIDEEAKTEFKKCRPPPIEFTLEEIDVSFLNSLTEWFFTRWMEEFKDMWGSQCIKTQTQILAL